MLSRPEPHFHSCQGGCQWTAHSLVPLKACLPAKKRCLSQSHALSLEAGTLSEWRTRLQSLNSGHFKVSTQLLSEERDRLRNVADTSQINLASPFTGDIPEITSKLILHVQISISESISLRQKIIQRGGGISLTAKKHGVLDYYK